jgi:hypothetical protein
MNDELEQARKEQEEAERKINALFEAAGKALQARMADDPELRKLAYMLLFSNRLFNWALAEACALKGMSNEMVNILVKAQREKAAEGFEFAEMVKDFQDKQMPWLESRRREALVRQRSREKRIASMVQHVRKKNITLPCHSMEALFDCEFTHHDILVVVGERRAVAPILQLCARKYTETGGHTVLLSSNEVAKPNDRIAKHIIPPQIWRNAGSIYGDLKTVLEPLSKSMDPMGLLVVEDLDNMLMISPVAQSRQAYLSRSFGLLEQYQVDYGGAMILGVLTDEDPAGIDRIQIYPPPLLAKHVYVSWQEPKVSDIPSIVVGNDILLLSEIEKELATPE